MTEQEYDAIASACDGLLRAPGATLGRLALPLLHVINEHPNLTAQYSAFLSTSQVTATPAPQAGAATPGGTPRRAARALSRALRRPRPKIAADVASPGMPADVLIVSRLTRPEQWRATEDFYFGAMQEEFARLGARCVLALVDHVGMELEGEPLAGRVLLPRRVSPPLEVGLWRECLHASRVLRRLAGEKPTAPLMRAIARQAAAELRAGAALENLRLHGALTRLCRRLAPRILITTYEGDASERVIWHAARASPRPCLRVGYQHTTVLRRAHAIRRGVHLPSLACDPHVVLALGSITEAALAQSPALQPARLLVYGSHRRRELGPLTPRGERPLRCLVLPDAHRAECTLLFRFALDCAVLLPAVTFVLRPHPGMALHGADVRAELLQQLPANVVVSPPGATLESECAAARFCLYRGSSAVLHAVRAGLRPFCLTRRDELPFDPLWELTGWREHVAAPRDLARYLTDDMAAPVLQQAAEDYCDRYVLPVKPENLRVLLQLAG